MNTRLSCFPLGAVVVVAAGLMPGIGCDIPERPSLDPLAGTNPQDLQQERRDSQPLSEVEATREEPFPGSWESWYVHTIAGQPAGYSRITAETVANSPDADIRYTVDDRWIMRRGSSTFIQRLSQTSNETAFGKLLGFESALYVGPVVTRYIGTLDSDVLSVEIIRGSQSVIEKTPWPTGCNGLVAVEQSLHREPMKTGEKRVLTFLLPIPYRTAETTLECGEMAPVPLLGGETRSLLEIESEISAGGQTVRSLIWTDEAGTILKTYAPATRLISIRTDKATATQGLDRALQMATVALDVKGEIERSDEAQRVAYLLSPHSSAASDDATSEVRISIEPAPQQAVRSMANGTFQVLVSRSEMPMGKGFVVADLDPVEEDREPNFFIDHDAAMVRRIADAALAGRRDRSDRETALELALTVNVMVKERELAYGLSKASDVAQQVVGDCTEQAVLLAALLRAHDIPSRLAIGLVYLPGDRPRMVYHVWTLAHVDDSWLSLDATQGTITAADRVIFATTNLAAGQEYESMQPILDAIGRMEIAVIGVKY